MSSVAMSLRLPEYYAQRLEFLAKEMGRSKTDLIIDGLKELFADRLDFAITYLTDEQYQCLLDILNNPIPSDVQAKMDETLNYKFQWKRQN